MNNTKRLVTSLELSQGLKKAGYPQGGNQFYWQWHCVAEKYYLRTGKEVHRSVYPYNRTYAAPLCGETLKKLPDQVWKNGYCFSLILHVPGGDWLIRYTLSGRSRDLIDCGKKEPLADNILFQVSNKTLAGAAGLMWLYLKENGLLKRRG